MYRKTRNWISTVATLSITAVSLSAAPQIFDFEDPKGVNNAQFKLDAPLESITGTANGITGKVHFDRAAPEKTRGRIALDSASLKVGNPLMQEHLHSADWLAVESHPAITFEVNEVNNVRNEGNRIFADVTGRFTLKGQERTLTVPVSFTFLEDRLGARVGDPSVKGDLLVLRSEFEIDRNDFGIQPGQHTDTVSETIQISLAVAGGATTE